MILILDTLCSDGKLFINSVLLLLFEQGVYMKLILRWDYILISWDGNKSCSNTRVYWECTSNLAEKFTHLSEFNAMDFTCSLAFGNAMASLQQRTMMLSKNFVGNASYLNYTFMLQQAFHYNDWHDTSISYQLQTQNPEHHMLIINITHQQKRQNKSSSQ